MSQSMLTIVGEKKNQKNVQVHLLPCRINHDGNVDPIDSHWSPSGSQDGLKTVYFRGKKLLGKAMKLPEGYYGSVGEKGASKPEVPKANMTDEDADVEETHEVIEVAPLNGKAQFDSFVVWGHESTAESGADPYVRGIEEWVSFAEQMHSYPSQDVAATK